MFPEDAVVPENQTDEDRQEVPTYHEDKTEVPTYHEDRNEVPTYHPSEQFELSEIISLPSEETGKNFTMQFFSMKFYY